MLIQGDVILVPHICFILLQEVVYLTWSNWQHLSQSTVLILRSYLRPKAAPNSGIYILVLILSDLSSATIHPIVTHGHLVRLVHIHLDHIPFSVSQHGRPVLNEKELIL